MPGGPSQEFMTDIPEAVVQALRQRAYSFVNCYGEPTEKPYSDFGLVRGSKIIGFLAYRAEGLNLAWKLFVPTGETALVEDVTTVLSGQSQHLRKVIRKNPTDLLRTRN